MVLPAGDSSPRGENWRPHGLFNAKWARPPDQALAPTATDLGTQLIIWKIVAATACTNQPFAILSIERNAPRRHCHQATARAR